jgi:hypothetical protein
MKHIHTPHVLTAPLLYHAAFVSLLVAFAASFMWVRSYRVAENWGWATSAHDPGKGLARYVYFKSARGGLAVYVHDYRNTAWGYQLPLFHSTDDVMQYPHISTHGQAIAETSWDAAGFAFCRARYHRAELWIEHDGRCYPADDASRLSCIVPWWSIAVAGMLLPALALRRLLEVRLWHRRSRAGLCPACGYDLRASPDRCPECGTVPDPKLDRPATGT